MVHMCPDRQILSLYLDGELPSPWKEKLEGHLASCPGCRARIESWKRLSEELRLEDEPDRKERVWERIIGSSAVAANGVGDAARGEGAPPRAVPAFARARSLVMTDLWRRRVSLPLPAAAALGAAAAAFVFILSSMWLKPSRDVVPPAASQFASLETAGIDMELRDIPSVVDGTGLLQYLESTDSSEIVIIRLPESRSFRSAGEPKIIRAADYSLGRPLE
jgi:hypothetical protein